MSGSSTDDNNDNTRGYNVYGAVIMTGVHIMNTE